MEINLKFTFQDYFAKEWGLQEIVCLRETTITALRLLSVLKISRSTLNSPFIICSSTLYDSDSPSTTRYNKQTDLESKYQTRHFKFTPFGLRYKLRARHTESVKVFLETSDTNQDFGRRVYNVHNSLKISEFQFSSFTVRSDRFTVLPVPIKTWDSHFYWSRLYLGQGITGHIAPEFLS